MFLFPTSGSKTELFSGEKDKPEARLGAAASRTSIKKHPIATHLTKFQALALKFVLTLVSLSPSGES
jgi:hypothetical protein